MPLDRGARLGPYRIDAEIGAGGMGHVFRATDTRLDRAVAIKVLPEHRWSDPQLRLRFEREARALSSLSHPNLCPLYDVGEQDSAPYLVMELLEGETLRDRLRTAPLSMRKALTWAAQIAHGLAAAHQKGVIHRDLKPENIFVTEGDLLKILDFGLAVVPEMNAAKTAPGYVMGTATYMSPEQVRGTALDARSDIFSLGIVLFEMLAGRVPFKGSSPVETMNAILVEDAPDLAWIVSSIPESVETIVRRCLEKDPAQRFSSARDLAWALETTAQTITSSAPSRRTSAPTARPIAKRTRIAILGAIAISVLAAALLSRDRFDSGSAPEPPRLRTLTWSGRDGSPAASPDGRLIAYVSSRDGARRIWIEQLADGTEAAVTSGPDDTAPRFSPDGSSLLFTRTANGASALHRVPVLGGEPRKLIDNAFDGEWSPDGKRVAFIRNRTATQRYSTLCIAPVDGGEVREIAASTEEDFSAPRWSPAGTWIAITRAPHSTAAGSLLLVDPESREQRVLSREEPHGLLSGAAWTRGGDALIYAELEALAGRGLPRLRGSSVIVLHDADSGRARVLLRNAHSAADTVDIAGAGRIVFTEDATRQSLQEIALDGTRAPRWLSRGMSVDRQPAYARNGASVIFTSDRGGNADLWELMLDSGTVRRVTDHGAIDWDPQPAPDGTQLYWSSNRGGHFEVWSSAIDGANPRQVTRDGVDAENPSLSAAGDWVFYDSSNPKSDGIWRIPRGGGEAKLVVAAETVHPSVSADGEYVVYQRPEDGGASAIDVVRVSDGHVFNLASGISGVTARAKWIGATHSVAYRAPDATGRIALFAQSFEPGVNTIATRRTLLAADSDAITETFAFSPDGKRAILSVTDEASGLMMAEGVAALQK